MSVIQDNKFLETIIHYPKQRFAETKKKYFRPTGRKVSSATQIHHYSMKAAVCSVSMNRPDCVAIKLYLQKLASGWIWHSIL